MFAFSLSWDGAGGGVSMFGEGGGRVMTESFAVA